MMFMIGLFFSIESTNLLVLSFLCTPGVPKLFRSRNSPVDPFTSSVKCYVRRYTAKVKFSQDILWWLLVIIGTVFSGRVIKREFRKNRGQIQRRKKLV